MRNEKIVEFVGKPIRSTFNSDNFKVYALDVDFTKYTELIKNKYGNITINGDLPELTLGIEYEISAIPEDTKYGKGYKVKNIKRDTPTSEHDVYLFLSEILTFNQAKVVSDNYPDIIQRVKENRLDDVDLSKLNGIKEKTFAVIKRKIIENFCLADLVIEFQGLLSLSMIKKIYDKYSSVEKLKEKLKIEPYKCLCGIAGVGFKTADSILRQIEKVSKKNIEEGKSPIVDFECDLKTSLVRCLGCIIYILEENQNDGHTKMNLAELRTNLLKMAQECSHHFAEAITNENIYYNKNTMDISLKTTRDVEQYIANTMFENLFNEENKWNYDTSKYRQVNGSDLSEEQMSMLKNICNYNICILNGFAGSGKSYSTQALINMLDDNHKAFKLLAPTGRAAKVLAGYTGRPASTIHRGLGYSPVMGWTFNKNHKLQTDVIVVDESSMTDIFLFKHLIEAINFEKTKLLLVGDSAQLPSVSCGNLLHDFATSKIIPTSTLNTVFRYGEGGLMKVATDVRNCKKYLDKSMSRTMTSFGKNKDYSFIDVATEHTKNSVLALYKKLLGKGYSAEDIQVLSAQNKGEQGTLALNKAIQAVANPNYGNTLYFEVGESVYYEKDIIIQTQNNYDAVIAADNDDDIFALDNDEPPTAFIANGEIGVVKQICSSNILIDFDGIVVKYNKADMQSVMLGYSISIHKSQGGSAKVIILVSPSSHIFMMNSNLLYVGLTRMKEKCYHIGSLQSVNQAVEKKSNLSRHTFMQEMLKELKEQKGELNAD